jgi:hypothetical protein
VNRKVTVPVGGLATTLSSSSLPLGEHYSSGAFPEPPFTRLPKGVSQPSQNSLIRAPQRNVRSPIVHRSVGVPTGVSAPTLLLGKRGDDLAAEVGYVGDYAAPDRAGSG